MLEGNVKREGCGGGRGGFGVRESEVDGGHLWSNFAPPKPQTKQTKHS
jgi:hypothetical protein